MTARWSLFVDESGDFGPTEPSLVAGILVEGPPDAFGGARLREQLGAIWGPGPWPPHAAHLNRTGARVLYALHPAREAMNEGKYAAQARVVVHVLADALRASTMATRVAEIADGAFPTYDDCKRADHLLSRHPAYGALRKLAEDQERAMGQLVAHVCERARGTVVAAVADGNPPGAEPAVAQLREDAYVRALTIVADRVARLAGAHSVDCLVLTRDVQVGGLGTAGLQGHLLKPLLERAAKASGSPARLRASGGTHRYRDYADQGRPLHPMLVLADWVSNRLRAAAGWFRGGYPALEASIVTSLIPFHDVVRRAPVRAPTLGGLPTIAAAGLAESEMRAAFEGPSAPPGGGKADERLEHRRWVWDQAHEWAATAGRWP